MLYSLYDMEKRALSPFVSYSKLLKAGINHPGNPFGYTVMGRMFGAAVDVFDSLTAIRDKPEWQIDEVERDGKTYAVENKVTLDKPFCELRFFEAIMPKNEAKTKLQPILLVAPMSGHFATLLRDTVRQLLTQRDVYITDWKNARDVPLSKGHFGLSHYMKYIMDFLTHIGPQPDGKGGGAHAIAVCQPAPLLLAATALLAEDKSPVTPRSITLMGGPVDASAAHTLVTHLAANRDINWFRHSNINRVPHGYEGENRKVYPGFLQLRAFWAMNPARHSDAHRAMFQHLVKGDDDSADRTRDFYNEYMAVLDVTAEFYLETVYHIFQQHSLKNGALAFFRERMVTPSAINKTGLLTIEGELDDISAPGQTLAAHEICNNIPEKWKAHKLQKNVGHYGIFNGKRWRQKIAPAIMEFITNMDKDFSSKGK